MNNLIESIRAKDKEVPTGIFLKDHILDTLKQLETFHDFVITNNDSIDYDKIKDERLFRYVAKALFLHDLGKIDYSFQEKIFGKDGEKESGEWKTLRNILKDLRGMKEFKIRHEILSILWSVFLLGNSEEDKKIRTAVLLHHYNQYFINQEKDIMEIILDYKKGIKIYLEFLKNNKTDIKNFLNLLIEHVTSNLQNEAIKESINDLKNRVEKITLIDDFIVSIRNHENDLCKYAEFYAIDNENPDYDFLVLLGILRRCDYSGSANIEIESEKDMKKFFAYIDDEIKKQIREKYQDAYLWQKDVINDLDSKNTVLVAPTGSGKTEFALLWAKKHERKLLYTLPLRVALNDLYTRFRGKEDEKGYFKQKEKVDLLHSTSFIEYIKEEREAGETSIESKLTSSKLFSNPVILSTPDQVFLSSLNFYGSDKLIGVYPLSSIVLDEIQTYNAEMSAIIIKTLEIIRKLKGNTLIITATFPPYFKQFLSDYEIIDIESSKIKDKIKNYKRKRHRIELVDRNAFVLENNRIGSVSEEFIDKIKKSLDTNSDKNILIIVNTVGKSIKLYEELKNLIGEKNLYLLHSRLIEREKTKSMFDIKLKLKKMKNENVTPENRIILVSTQLVEASVDVDFDIMFTEISTIDSQIQRWGRIYRNRDQDFDENESNIVIFTGTDKFTNYIYDKSVVEKTIDVLNRLHENSILDYTCERKLIEDVFEEKIDGKTLSEKYVEEIKRNLDYMNYFSVEKKSEAQKLFRKLAGVSVIIPELFNITEIHIDSKAKEAFIKILKDKNNKLSWSEIIKEIKKSSQIECSEKEFMWKLKALLYENSLNLPIFYYEKFRYKIFSHEFKGFQVLKNIKDSELNEVLEKGIDIIFESGIDDEEISEFENA